MKKPNKEIERLYLKKQKIKKNKKKIYIYMSDSVSKYYEQEFYWDEQKPIRKINNSLSPLQANDILNRAIFSVEDMELKEELFVLKDYLKSLT